jgi:hypothetical protein
LCVAGNHLISLFHLFKNKRIPQYYFGSTTKISNVISSWSFYTFPPLYFVVYYVIHFLFNQIGGCRGRDIMVVGFTTTYAICAHHHRYEFESDPGKGVQHYLIKVVMISDLQQIGGFLRVVNSTTIISLPRQPSIWLGKKSQC